MRGQPPDTASRCRRSWLSPSMVFLGSESARAATLEFADPALRFLARFVRCPAILFMCPSNYVVVHFDITQLPR